MELLSIYKILDINKIWIDRKRGDYESCARLEEELYNQILKSGGFKEYGVAQGRVMVRSIMKGSYEWLPIVDDKHRVLTTKILVTMTMFDDLAENTTKIPFSKSEYIKRGVSTVAFSKLPVDPLGIENCLYELIQEFDQFNKHPVVISNLKQSLVRFLQSTIVLSDYQKQPKPNFKTYMFIRDVDVGLDIMISNIHFIFNDRQLTTTLVTNHIFNMLVVLSNRMVTVFNDFGSYAKEYEFDGALSNPLTFLQQQFPDICPDMYNACLYYAKEYKSIENDFIEYKNRYLEYATIHHSNQLDQINLFFDYLDDLLGSMCVWQLHAERYQRFSSPFIESLKK